MWNIFPLLHVNKGRSGGASTRVPLPQAKSLWSQRRYFGTIFLIVKGFQVAWTDMKRNNELKHLILGSINFKAWILPNSIGRSKHAYFVQPHLVKQLISYCLWKLLLFHRRSITITRVLAHWYTPSWQRCQQALCQSAACGRGRGKTAAHTWGSGVPHFTFHPSSLGKPTAVGW